MKLKSLTRSICGAAIAAVVGAASMSAAVVTKATGSRAMTVPEPTTTVAGIMVTNDDWSASSPASGVYYIEVKPGGKITPQYLSTAMADVVSAVKKDNVMYTAEATADFRYYYRQMSTSDWSTIGSRQEIDMEDVPADLTYDATLGKAYGSFWNENYGGFSYFGNFNLTSASWTSIDKVQRDERDIFALAADGKGTIYCLFGAYNYLATLDPVTGQVNRIKTTGLEIDTNWAEGRVSSMCYDEENDRLIASVSETLGWGANKSYRSGLYSINPHTGDVEKVMDFDGNACFAGLYVVDAAPDATAPGEPSNLSVNIEGTATAGTVSFTMPLKTLGGSDLGGSLIAIINLNGEETAIFDLVPGQEVTSPAMQFVTGENSVKVTVADTEHRGGSQSISFWAGEDTPLPVTDVVLEVTDGKATLSWTAPAGGAHDGPVDPDNIRYLITRLPEGKVVAAEAAGTSYVDTDLDLSVKTIYYTVKAFNATGSAEPVESNRCLAAGSFTVPFIEGFNTADDFALWTIEDLNGGTTWKYNNGQTEQCVEYEYEPNKLPADDWLISPPIRLEADKAYKLSYKWRVMMKSYPESFEVKLGTSSSAATMTTSLGRHDKVTNTAYQSADCAVSVDKDGDYYIGIHCYSDGYMYILRVDDIELVEIDNRVPAVIDDLEVIPYDNGVRSATVKFTVPTLDNKGGELEAVTSATISRNGKELAVLTDVEPGKAVTYEDTTVDADGVMSYSVSCANETGSSVAAVKEAYVGVDAPGAVVGLTIAEVSNHPYLSWEAPAQGVNGGWFDAQAVVYRIVRSDGTVVTENCPDTEYTDASYTSPTTGQDAVWYLVTPYVGTTKGAYAQSELLLCGKPYTTPAAETFAKADMTYYPWISQSSNAIYYAWTLDEMGYNPQAPDQNGDRGLATFHSVGEPVGTVSYFYSPKFDISTLASPALSFYLYHAPGEGNESLELLISDGGDTFSPLAGTDVIKRTDAEGWTRYSVSLAAYKTAPWVRIGFKGTGDGVADMYIDNVTIDSQLETDLSLVALKAPARIAAGEQIHLAATVLNAGLTTVSDATLRVSDGNDALLATIEVPEIEAGRETTLEFSVEAATIGALTVKAELTATGDGDASNNKLTAGVNVVTPTVNAPSNLSGSLTGNTLTLTWDAPSADGVVTDDVESYADWAISGIGEWSMWDGDYDITYSINNAYGDYPNGDYPNATARKAFQVCNADKLGINIWDEGKTHSGDKMFMALCSYTYVNNDWLISPELNGMEQWISFYARSFTLQNIPAERMRVWYSTTDNDPANFTEITTSYVELPGTWQEYRYYLPEGAKYFAVNCVSDGAFAMFVDDLSFNDLTVPTWTIDHYEIYLDGEKIGESTDTSYSTENADQINAGGRYTVKAVYDRGESPMSDGVTISSGVGTVGVAGISVEEHSGEITVRGAAGMCVEIVASTGIVMYTEAEAADEVRYTAAPGMYIVRAGTTAVKVAVK